MIAANAKLFLPAANAAVGLPGSRNDPHRAEEPSRDVISVAVAASWSPIAGNDVKESAKCSLRLIPK